MSLENSYDKKLLDAVSSLVFACNNAGIIPYKQLRTISETLQDFGLLNRLLVEGAKKIAGEEKDSPKRKSMKLNIIRAIATFCNVDIDEQEEEIFKEYATTGGTASPLLVTQLPIRFRDNKYKPLNPQKPKKTDPKCIERKPVKDDIKILEDLGVLRQCMVIDNKSVPFDVLKHIYDIAGETFVRSLIQEGIQIAKEEKENTRDAALQEIRLTMIKFFSLKAGVTISDEDARSILSSCGKLGRTDEENIQVILDYQEQFLRQHDDGNARE